MLNKKEQLLKAKILKAKKQDEIIQIYQNEEIPMSIINDKQVLEHIRKYISIEEDETASHIYLRKKATKEYLDYTNKKIQEIALTNK